jgi:inhibitor of KinA
MTEPAPEPGPVATASGDAPRPCWTPLGDAALTIRFEGVAPDRGSERILPRVLAAVARLDAATIPGVSDVAATFTTVTLFFDPLRWSAATLAAAVLPRLDGLGDARLAARRVVEIPVVYGGADGPDLDDVAVRTGLAADEVVRLHASAEYVVAMVGFAPGFPYLVGLPARLAVPRLDTPRLRVPAGSVGIGGGQTGVYPRVTPGGWRIIGRTPRALFDPDRDPPALVAAGDVVRFRPIATADVDRTPERRP